eukprot:6429140-Pyramimonas_sp.AAC.1
MFVQTRPLTKSCLDHPHKGPIRRLLLTGESGPVNSRPKGATGSVPGRPRWCNFGHFGSLEVGQRMAPPLSVEAKDSLAQSRESDAKVLNSEVMEQCE